MLLSKGLEAVLVQLTNKIAWILYPIGDEASVTARNSSEVICALSQRCYPQTKTEVFDVFGCLSVCIYDVLVTEWWPMIQ